MRYFIVILLFCTTYSFSQQRTCGSVERMQIFLKEHPQFITNRNILEQKTERSKIASKTNITIPIVVHVVYANSFQNISDAQILSQIDVLNEDFRRTNADAFNTPTDFSSIVSDMQINFCLATKTPDGQLTNGIIRKQTTYTAFTLLDDNVHYDSLGGSSAWDTDQYLNIWVCKINGGVLGWAQFPAGGIKATDGVVIDFRHIGTQGVAIHPYNLGRTATHEIGHWLNLFHIWGDDTCGDDFVNDTPTQEDANYGCKIHPNISCNNNGDMFMNFMDYTNDACMNSFSEGQKNRVWSAIYNYRDTLLSSTACSPPITPNSDAGITHIIYPNDQNIDCANPIYPIVVIKNFGATILNTAVIKYQINSGAYQYQYWNGDLLPNETDTVLLAGIGGSGISNIFTATTQSPNNSPDINTSNDAQNIVYSSIEGRRIELRITTDNYANETSWLLMNQNGTIIDSRNNLSNNTLYQHSYCLPSDCYYFIINDVHGDGFCCNYGNGNYNMTFENSNTILASGNQFAFSDTSYFCINSVGVTDIIKNHVLLYPNPTSGKLWIKTVFTNENKIILANLFNGLGELVMQTTVDNNNSIDLSHLKEGIYVLNLQDNGKHYSKKIIIQNR